MNFLKPKQNSTSRLQNSVTQCAANGGSVVWADDSLQEATSIYLCGLCHLLKYDKVTTVLTSYLVYIAQAS